jgi:hypothetical protein
MTLETPPRENDLVNETPPVLKVIFSDSINV